VEGGGVRPISVGGATTGLRADFFLSDDLIAGIQVANSSTQLDSIWQWFLADFRTRLKPQGSEAVIGTRWATRDPIGRLMELSAASVEPWRHLRIPLLADSDNDPLHRKQGERLWPEWFSSQHVHDSQRDHLLFKCLQQQTPIDDKGIWAPPEHIQRVAMEDVPKRLKYFITGDLALSIRSGDYTVFLLMALCDKRNLYILDIFRQQVSADVSSETLINWCARRNPTQVLMDDDNATRAWSRLVAELARKHGVAVPLRLVKIGNRDKEDRASNFRSYLMRNKVFILDTEEMNQLVKELLDFPGGKTDDTVDCCALAGLEYLKISAPAQEEQLSKLIRTALPTALTQGDDGVIRVTSTLEEMFKARERERGSVSSTVRMRI
jgi:predicted phage terminase large subunit-like protein